MRGTKAKALRRIANAIGSSYPDIAYEDQQYYSVAGVFNVTLPVTLAPSKRKIYKGLKKRM